MSSWGSRRVHLYKSFRRFHEDLSGVLSSVKLWKKSLHQIGGNIKIQSDELFWALKNQVKRT